MGALTLKVFADELREWELIEGEGIDLTDGFGTNLRVSIRENQIFLAEPNDPEMPWLTDRGRLFFDGMFEKMKLDDSINWNDFFDDFSESLYFLDHFNFHKHKHSFLTIVMDNVSLETLNMLYILEQSFSFIKLRKIENNLMNNDFESYYQLNKSSQKSKLAMSSLGILLNTNTRLEGYVLNLNLRHRFLKGEFKLLSIGSVMDISLPISSLGSNMSVLRSIGEGTHLFCQDIKNSSFPILITNSEIFKRSDFKYFAKVLKHTQIINTAWNGLNVLNTSISGSGVNSLNNFLPISNEDYSNFFCLYFINVSLDAIPNFKKIIELHLLNLSFANNESSFKLVVNQNNNNDKELYKKLNLNSTYHYLPNNLFLEDNETYINTQGLIKRITKLINFKKNAKSNWQIIRKLYANSKKLSFLNNIKDTSLISFDCKNSFNYKNFINFQYYAVNSLTGLSFYLIKQNKPIIKNIDSSIRDCKIKVFNTKLKFWLDDFFMKDGKDSFSYNSSVMSRCSRISRSNSTNFF